MSDRSRVAVYLDFDNMVISRYDNLHGDGSWRRDNARDHRDARVGVRGDAGGGLRRQRGREHRLGEHRSQREGRGHCVGAELPGRRRQPGGRRDCQ